MLRLCGLSIAGIFIDLTCTIIVCCLMVYLYFFGSLIPLGILIGFASTLAIVAAAGFVHVAFIKIVRNKLLMKPLRYYLITFVGPMVLGVPFGLFSGAIAVPLVGGGSGGLGIFVLILLGYLITVVGSMLCGISALCLGAIFGVLKPLPANDRNVT